MLIIFGTRPYFQSNKVTQHGFCAHCDQFVKAKSFDAMRFFHLYYIPLIPTQGKKRNHKQCPKCSTSQVFELEEFANLIHQFKEQSADAVLAAMEGEETFLSPSADGSTDGEPIEAVPYLHSVFDWLYASGNAEFCDNVLTQLASPTCAYARHMLAASLSTMRGNLDGAIDLYGSACTSAPEDSHPVIRRAHLLIERRRVDEAIADYKKAIQMSPDPNTQLGLYAQMVDQQMAQKQFADAVVSYEKLIEIDPNLANEKVIAKGLKKARKKAGVA